jgi:hypothetical protein
VRAADPGFQLAVDERLDREIARRELAVLTLEPARSDDWLDQVERVCRDRFGPDQLELLPPGPG